jgi:2-oxoglutarate dehydrogenase E1 component
MYHEFTSHQTVRELFARAQVEAGQCPPELPDALVQKHRDVLEKTLAALEPEREVALPPPTPAAPGVAGRAHTGVPVERLREINARLLEVPTGFTQHKKLQRGRERRRDAFANASERTVDWATAEELALATILADGIPVRLTGEDVERGTFSQRHAVFHDASDGTQWIPLQTFSEARAAFDVHNSPLSENATIGFECGYNLQAPGSLVIWEAQYGDFINGAQVILDEFVTSGRAKWDLKPSLVFLLPHAYEGQGPDHSTARPERLLQAAADINLRLVNCTTPAQYFHLLRRQAHLLAIDPLPLFVLTPKGLLRHPAVRSTPLELEQGRFLSVIDDAEARTRSASVTRLVLCSGKVYVDLVTSPRRAADRNIAICRVEQLYPFPGIALGEVVEGYPALTEVVWLQEEPENMGAWEFMRPCLEEIVAGRCPLRYVGRVRSSSPAEGSAAWHQLNQTALIDQAFILDSRSPDAPLVLSKPA